MVDLLFDVMTSSTDNTHIVACTSMVLKCVVKQTISLVFYHSIYIYTHTLISGSLYDPYGNQHILNVCL